MPGPYGYTPPADAAPQRGLSGPPGPDVNFADCEIPSGSADGMNKDFTLTHSPNPATSLMLHMNGMLQQGEGNDYTLTGNVIHFETAPVAESTILASYRY